jgi:hypothetical protein
MNTRIGSCYFDPARSIRKCYILKASLKFLTTFYENHPIMLSFSQSAFTLLTLVTIYGPINILGKPLGVESGETSTELYVNLGLGPHGATDSVADW